MPLRAAVSASAQLHAALFRISGSEENASLLWYARMRACARWKAGCGCAMVITRQGRRGRASCAFYASLACVFTR